MKPLEVDIQSLVTGDTFEGFEIELTDDNNAPIDLNGCIIQAEMRNRFDQATSIKTFTVGNGLTAINLSLGKFKFNDFTERLEINTHWIDLRITYLSGKTFTYARFKFEVENSYINPII